MKNEDSNHFKLTHIEKEKLRSKGILLEIGLYSIRNNISVIIHKY